MKLLSSERETEYEKPFIKPTLCGDNISLENIFQPHEQDFSKWANHCEDHPNIYHLDVMGAWKCLADSDETERMIFFII